MPTLNYADVSIYYEEFGSGYPLLLLAPGGIRSKITTWRFVPFDPRKEFASNFRVVAMDQRHCGRSRAPLDACDGWEAYAADQLALLDHLGIRRCHVMGACVGCSFAFALMKADPRRVSAVVLQDPVGRTEHADWLRSMLDYWETELVQQRPDIDPAAAHTMGENLFAGDFIFSVSRDFARKCRVPMLILPGDDVYHDPRIAGEIAQLAPDAELLGDWRIPTVLNRTVERVRQFLLRHQ
ncbi:MAG TPA: alpha/beta hydrolase [Candidatus Binataceae bacterium]|nr:alpha/beta hydrolase [Candidatus Binataceae bacterium]